MSSNQEKAVLENIYEPESVFESVEEDVFISNKASNTERRSCGMTLLDSFDKDNQSTSGKQIVFPHILFFYLLKCLNIFLFKYFIFIFYRLVYLRWCLRYLPLNYKENRESDIIFQIRKTKAKSPTKALR